jgi:RNA polymerase sigma factor (sigma-70 family)
MTAKQDDGHKPGTDELLPTRQTLLERLRNWEDDLGWQEFFDTYWRLIYQVSLKAGLRPVEAEEVVQETVVSVAKAMPGFHYDRSKGSFKGWLLQLTGWRITNQLRKRTPDAAVEWHSHSPGRSDPPEAKVEPDLVRLWDAEWEDNLLHAALKRVRHQVNPKHFQIFDLCVRKNQSVQSVRDFLGVSRGEIYLARHRVSKLVQREVHRLRDRLL